jgi:transcriptional regulator with XRE-family HTH domain
VDIGPALTEARTKAGMTIQDVSERTRIRGKLISDIERDDYSACGGDFYTRGHIRAIAKAVGTDPVPLIEQYDGNAAAAAAPPVLPDPEPVIKPQATSPKTGDSSSSTRPEADPRRTTRQGRSPGREAVNGAEPGTGAGGDSGAGAGLAADGEPDAGSETAGAAEPEVGGKPAADGSLSARAEPDVTRELAVGGEPEVTQELAVGGEPAPALWQRPAPQPANGQARLGIATDRLRQSADNVRRAGADAYRQSVPRVRQAGADAYRRAVPQARRAGEQARRAGEQAVQRTGPWARQATAGVYDRISRLRTTDRRWSVIIGAGVVVLAGLIVLIYMLVSGPSHAASGATRPTVSRSAPPRRPARAPSPSSARHARSHSPVAHVASPPAGPLQPVSVAAFGPGGTGQGDNPQQASLALSGRNGGWHTNWYVTANFGNLQSGTGLLLDMGRAVTVTKARIDLGSAAGGALELRAGNQAVLSDLVPVVQSADTGGTLTLAPSHPVAARYLLIWFTRLPRDNAGTYQATIYHVDLTGSS